VAPQLTPALKKSCKNPQPPRSITGYAPSTPGSQNIFHHVRDAPTALPFAIRPHGAIVHRRSPGQPPEGTISSARICRDAQSLPFAHYPGPGRSLEKALQFIKGGFSYRVKKELNLNFAIWQAGFTNHRVRDPNDYAQHRSYIHQNPVKAGLADRPELFHYSSAFPGTDLDAVPSGLKPIG